MKIIIESDQILESSLSEVSLPVTAGINGGAAANPTSNSADEFVSSPAADSINAGDPPNWLIQELSAAVTSNGTQIGAIDGGSAPIA
ncbi:hypothetical protein [Floridanema aerugineum]|uniref:Uncharacterized protein n=1 Tax=Floridaenema aerugineum BLCC-F46 TaxID=3153654 RepID=A0ABV4X4N5_9CYAN